MASTSVSQRPKARDGVLSTLDVIIQGLDLAKDSCGFPPAQAAFGAVSILLNMLRVCFSLLCDDELLIHIHPELYGQ